MKWTPTAAVLAGLFAVMLSLSAQASVPAETLLVIEPTKSQPRNSEGDIIALADGRLCLIYSRFRGGGADHSAADLARRISSDGGRTWSSDEVVVPMKDGLNVMSVSLLRLQNGAIALFYLRKTSMEDCRPVMHVSTDEGQHWSEPTVCISDQVGYYVLNNDRAVQLKRGRIVLPVALHRKLGDSQADWNGTVMCYLSDDQGQTWRRSKHVRQGFTAEGERVLTQEPGVVELRDGRLMMFCRAGGGRQYIAYSEDGGDSWSELRPSNLASPVSPATIERLPSTGQLLCVWNDHSGAHSFPEHRRTPLCIAVSDDDGKTWSASQVLESYPYGWYCYTSMTFHQGRVLLSYCAGDTEVGGLNRLKVVAIPEAALQPAVEARHAERAPQSGTALDYGRSFVNTKAVWNSPRFWVESRCQIVDEAADQRVEYLQCGSCKSEDTFAAWNLFHKDNYDFLPVFSARETLVFRHRVSDKTLRREVRPTEKWWDGSEPRLKKVQARVLSTPQQIWEAMESGQPIVGQTRLVDEASGRTALLEYPIKTINWHREQQVWQVDTGPVLLPDLSQPRAEWSNTVQLAYIAFNHADWADFVVKQSTPVVQGDKEVAQVPHYSRIVNRRAQNVLLAIGEE